MFVGRQNELNELQEGYDSGTFQCVVLYGRRRNSSLSWRLTNSRMPATQIKAFAPYCKTPSTTSLRTASFS